MASIERRPDGRWRARWREYPAGPQRTKHFPRKLDAEKCGSPSRSVGRSSGLTAG
jgi:hypothetical protein